MLKKLWKLKNAKTGRCSSWEKNGRNADWIPIPKGKSVVIADIKGPGLITHIWMTTGINYREFLIKITWDNAEHPSVLVPMGDFFCLGNSIVNSFQNMLFSASTAQNNQFNKGCALNCYVPMPFKERAVVELVNEAGIDHRQYFYVDYETYDDISELSKSVENIGYFHAEFHRENPFGGWGHEIRVNSEEANIANKEQLAWDNNYVILETKGRGHYIGCNYSVSNFQGTWWGEGDDMIWVDGYKWPPDLHGTGSEDYLNQAWGMQPNAFLRNGSSIYEEDTDGYQTSYVFHIENPVRFTKEIKVTIEFGHGNHLRNEVSTVAYWYAEKPTKILSPPPVEKRKPVLKRNGEWIIDEKSQITTREIPLNEEMKRMKRRWRGKDYEGYFQLTGKTSLDGDGMLCLNIPFSPLNPEIYEVPFTEIIDYFVGKNVMLDYFGKKTSGTIKIEGEEKLFLVGKDTKIELEAIFKDSIGKEIQMDALQILDDEKKEFAPAEYILTVF
jgi:D-arabinan exo alpha-(1,3)/(1,5)-arabinofuranosidase (non-reducing end)